MQTLKGEWEKDTTIGVPWLEDVFIKNYSQNLVESYIAKTILSTEGVKSLTSISSIIDKPNRRMVISFEATSIYGEDFSLIVQT